MKESVTVQGVFFRTLGNLSPSTTELASSNLIGRLFFFDNESRLRPPQMLKDETCTKWKMSSKTFLLCFDPESHLYWSYCTTYNIPIKESGNAGKRKEMPWKRNGKPWHNHSSINYLRCLRTILN